MEKKFLLLPVLIGITLITLLIFVFNIGGDAFPVIKQVLIVLFSLCAFSSLFFLFRYYGVRTEEGKVWLLLSAGFFLFFLGEAVTLFLLDAQGVAAYPSYADGLRLLAYPLIFSSMFLESRWIGMKIKDGDIFLFSSLSLLLVAILAYFIFIPAMASDADPLEKMLNATYPISSLGLFLFSIGITRTYWGGLLSSSWKVLSAAFGTKVIADVMFVHSTLSSAHLPGSICGFLFILSYSLIILAAICRSASWKVEFEGLG